MSYKLVPVEPTYEMVQTGAKLVKENLPYHTGTKAIYEVMVAAAPAPAAPAGERLIPVKMGSHGGLEFDDSRPAITAGEPDVAGLVDRLRDIAQAKDARLANVYKTCWEGADKLAALSQEVERLKQRNEGTVSLARRMQQRANTAEQQLAARDAEIAGLQKNVLAWVERCQQAQKDWDKEHATVDRVLADARANTQRWLDAESELTALRAELAALRAEHKPQLTKRDMKAIACALGFILAGEYEHETLQREDFERALEKVRA